MTEHDEARLLRLSELMARLDVLKMDVVAEVAGQPVAPSVEAHARVREQVAKALNELILRLDPHAHDPGV
jgi:hypothetical protein